MLAGNWTCGPDEGKRTAMTNPSMSVDPQELARFAAASDSRAERMEQIFAELVGAHVDRLSFGLMPASGDLHTAYTEHADSCVAGMREGAEAMTGIAEGLRTEGEMYTAVELVNIDLLER